MPYVGRDLQRGNYLKLDDISSSFDGSTTTFNLTSGGNAFFPGSAFSIIVSLGGVIQEPESAFQIDKSQIIFAQAPTPNDDFFCIVQGVALGVGVPGHNTVGNNQLAKPLSYSDYFRWDSANNRVGINTLLPSVALDVVGDASFSGNVAIGGTLTYEDVANIDAVGLITARAGIQDKTLTEGHVIFTGTNGRLSGDSNLFYNNSTDRLGISTNNPQNTLEVVGTGITVFNESKTSGVDIHGAGKIELVRSDSVSYIDFKTSFSEDFDCRIQQVGNGLRFYTGGQGSTGERLRISSDGNFGINPISAPAYKLVINELDSATGTAHTMLSALNPVVYIDVGNEIDHNIVLKKHETDAQDKVGGLLFASSPDGTNYNWAGIKAIEDANAAVTDIAFFTAPNNSSGATSQERVRIHNTNVGIGTTDPEALLHIFQNNSTIGHDARIEQRGDGDAVLGFTLTGTRAYSMGVDNSDSDKFKFATGSDLATNTFVTIKSSGEVGIGSDIPTGQLEVLKSGTTGYLFRAMAGLGTIGNRSYDLKPPSWDSTDEPFSWSTGNSHAFQVDGVEKLRIAANGRIGIGVTVPDTLLHLQGDKPKLRIESTNVLEASLGTEEIARIEFEATKSTNRNVAASMRVRQDGTWSTVDDWFSPTAIEFYTQDQTGTEVTTPRFTINRDGNITVNGSTSNLFTSNSYNILELRADEDNDGGNDDCIFKFTHDGTFRSEMRYDESSSTLELSTSDNRDDFSMDTDGKVTFKKDIATAQDYPNFRPTLDLNFAAKKKLDPRITYQRTGPASFTDELGKVVLVNGNTPRFDHDPLTKECKGLLIEQSRTNYVKNSLGLGSGWVAGAGSFAIDNSITNPDGSVGAYHHTGAELYHENIDLSSASTNTVIVSLWMKERSGQSGVMDIQIYQQITGSVVVIGAFSFDPATAVISTPGSNFSNGTVEEYPNGWYRISAKVTTSSGNFSSSTRYDIQGAEHYVWGFQMEVGEFLTSFIPTNGRAATRGTENVKIDGDDFTDFYNPIESTVACEFDSSNWITYNYNAYERIWSINNGSESDLIEMFKENTVSDAIRYRVRDGNVNVLGAFNISYGTNTTPKMAFAVKLNDAAAAVDGTISGTTDNVIPMPTVDRLILGNDNDNNQNSLNGYIRRFMYYPVKLPDSQVVTLTS